MKRKKRVVQPKIIIKKKQKQKTKPKTKTKTKQRKEKLALQNPSRAPLSFLQWSDWFPSSFSSASLMDHLPASLQALIKSTDALDLDSPLLATITDSPLHHHGAFSLLGQLLSPKPMNSQTVKDTLQHAWKFSLPLSFAVVGHHKYLFGISNPEHVQTILDQGPWNVRGSLLLLKPWSPDLALDEVNLNLCSFWVQVHGLPGQNMAAVNAVIIAQRLGKVLAVDHHDAKGLICQPFLRFRVELDATQPLIPGFHLPRSGRDPLWISFRYERLGDYCTLCGLIGHKRNQCIQPVARHTPDKYRIPLQTFSLVGLRAVPSPSRDDSDSGLSSVGTSPSHSDARSSPAQGAASSCLTSRFLFLFPMWRRLLEPLPCSSRPKWHSLILHCSPL